MKRTPIERRTPLRKSNPKRRKKLYAKQFGTYADVVRTFPCCVCGHFGADPHHVTTRGASGSKSDLVPLCRDHHREWHDKGRATFEAKYSVDLAAIARRLFEKYGNEEEA